MPDDTAKALLLWQSIPNWLAKLPPEQLKNDQFDTALDAVNKALVETRKYLSYRDEGGERDADKENLLSQLWNDASSAIRPYDPEFAELCWVKGHGWADRRVWSRENYKDLPTDIDEMFNQLRKISKVRPQVENDQKRKLEQYLAYAFGVVFIVVILVLAIAFPKPTPFQYTVFRIVLALAAAGVAVVVPGLLHVQVGTFVRAGGAIAVFVILFFFSPAKLTSSIARSSHAPTITNVRASGGAAGTAIVVADFDSDGLEPQYKLFAEISPDAQFSNILRRIAIERPEAGQVILSLPTPSATSYWLRFVLNDPEGEVAAVSKNPWQFTIAQ